jgi:putative methyltransferase (TIGR04325 family)
MPVLERFRLFLRRPRRNLPQRPVLFDRTYSNWPDNSAWPNPFDTAEWLDTVRAYLEKVRSEWRAGCHAPEHYIVPVAVLAAQRARDGLPVRLLDFGGGLGVNFFTVASALPPSSRFAWHVVDTPLNCAAGRELFVDEPRCQFHSSPPNDDYDLVLASSVLQYIPEWGNALTKLSNRNASYLCLTRLPMTTGPTFAARQQIAFTSGPHAGKSAGATPHWFFSREELIARLAANGYGLSYEHFISDYRPYLSHLAPPTGNASLTCMVFAKDAETA